MTKKFLGLFTAASVIAAATLLAGDAPSKTGEGAVSVAGKTYQLKHALAYETTIGDEEVIAVVLSGQPISSAKLKEAKEKDKENGTPDFGHPFIKLEFKKTGEFKDWGAGVGATTLGQRSGHATGEFKLEGGRIIGKASQPTETEGMFPSGFDVHFDVALIKAGDALRATKKPGPAANVKPTLTGTFKGNGKEAKLTFVSARWREPFDGKPSIVLVFSEKDHSKDPKPDFNASFGKFGSSLTVSLFEDGGIFGCEVMHTGLKKQGFSSVGTIKTNDFTFENGKVEGELTTEGSAEFFGDVWEVNLKFVAPLGEIPKQFEPAESKKPEKEAKRASDDGDDEPAPGKSDAKPSVPAIKAKDLALTKDAADIEYKALVEHLSFKSKSNVKAVCAELAVNLKAQGWKNDGSDMVNPQSSILKRKRGEAALTIFVKPADGGSEVKMMTEGLSWEED